MQNSEQFFAFRVCTLHRAVPQRYPKKVTQIRTISAIDGLLAANIVEQHVGKHLSEPEFHAESNNSGLITPN